MSSSRGEIFTFTDVGFLNLNVINTLSVPITIRADNYIDNGNSMELTIGPGDEETAKIYTKNPRFTSTSNYPIIFDWNVIGNEVLLIIR